MNTPEVLIEHADGLVIITINRPQQKNAVNRAVSYGVCEAIDEMERKTSQRYLKPGQHWASAIVCLKSPDYLTAQCGIHWFLFREKKFTLQYEKSH